MSRVSTTRSSWCTKQQRMALCAWSLCLGWRRADRQRHRSVSNCSGPQTGSLKDKPEKESYSPHGQRHLSQERECPGTNAQGRMSLWILGKRFQLEGGSRRKVALHTCVCGRGRKGAWNVWEGGWRRGGAHRKQEMPETRTWAISSSDLKWDVVKIDWRVKSNFGKIRSSVLYAKLIKRDSGKHRDDESNCRSCSLTQARQWMLCLWILWWEACTHL